MKICPCCGAELFGKLEDGCASCGARPVGPPLPPPEKELPAFGHTLFIGLAGSLLTLGSLAAVSFELYKRGAFWPHSPAELFSAATTAAWRTKHLLLPLSFITFWTSAKLFQRVRREPERFLWLRFARCGLALSALALTANLALALFFIPELLEQRRIAREAAANALLYGAHRMLLEYRELYGTYPSSLDDLRKLPDPDGSNAKLLAQLNTASYMPSSVQAAQLKTRPARSGARLRPVAARPETDNAVSYGLETVSFTDYELLWPGADGIYGTDDDRLIRDGVIVNDARSVKSASVFANANRKAKLK